MAQATDLRDILKRAQSLAAAGDQSKARDLLRAHFRPGADFALLAQACAWSKRVPWEGLRPLKVAFLGGGTLNHLVEALRFRLILDGFLLETWLAPYGTWPMAALNPSPDLLAFNPKIVWCFTNWRDYHFQAQLTADEAQADEICELALAETESAWRALQKNLAGAQIVQNNADPVPERLFGHYDAMLPGSLAGLIRRFNLRLPGRAAEAGAAVFDLDRVAAGAGLERWHDYAYWHHSKHPFAPDLTGAVAHQAARFLAAMNGAAKKVIVLDLDNTLWGGVIGDDGLEGIILGQGPAGEAFAAFQGYLKALAERGIVLAVASKNEEEAARLPFLRHPEMRLGLEDIAVFKASWNNKADSIRQIAEALNLGLDSFVFVDDNPAERELVRSELPMVAVPEMPEDSAEYIPALARPAYFEAAAFSPEDQARGRMYRENARRTEARANVTDLGSYLAGLEMRAESGPADAFHLPRMAQLINKSNQFHPTTTRYTEADLKALAESGEHIVRWFSLKDRFGDYGLIAVLVLKLEGNRFLIDTWAMSCRVLERGMEEYILREISAMAFEAGASELVGRYIPSPKNALVSGLYDILGFKSLEGELEPGLSWVLNLPMKNQRPLFIR